MKILTLSLLMAAPFAAVAQTNEISYDFVEFDYAVTETDAGAFDFDGSAMGFEGSVEVRERIHLAASLVRGEADDLSDTDSLNKTLGIGAHFGLFENRLSVFGQVGLADVDSDISNVNTSDDGFYGTAGVRYVPAAGYEIRGTVTYVDLDDTGNDTIPSIEGDIALTDVVALTLGISESDNSESFSLGLRFYFGNNAPRGFRR